MRELQQTIAYLKDKLKRAEMSLSRLHRTKNTLQHDIGKFSQGIIDSITPWFSMPLYRYDYQK